jgi:hypothetical protein
MREVKKLVFVPSAFAVVFTIGLLFDGHRTTGHFFKEACLVTE